VPDGSTARAGTPSPANRQLTADSRDDVISPGDLDSDDWDQEAALAAFMADVDSGYDLFTSSIGLEPDDVDWPPPGVQDAPPAADTGLLSPGGYPAGDKEARVEGQPGEDPVPEVPECFDAGFLPRVASADVRRGSGSGFASGNVLDTALPGPALGGFADTAAGADRGYAGLDDDELIGVLGGWQKTEAWAAAGKLSAVAELIRRRPGETSRVPGAASSPCPGPSTVPGSWTSASPGDDRGGRRGPTSNGSAAGNSAGDGPASNGPTAGDGPASNGGNGATGGGGGTGGGIPAGHGKFCADELAVALAISRWPAERMLALASDLATRLPLTRRALHEGVIDAYKAQIIAEATRVLDDAAAAAAEAAVIPTAVGKTPGQLRAAIARAVLKADPGAARQRREQAQRDARVELWREDAGTAALCGFGLPPDEALGADQRISDRALELKAAGVAGTMDQLRVRAYLDALLGQDTAAGNRRHGAGHPVQTGPGTPAGGSSVPEGGAGTADGSQQAGRDADQRAGLAARINLTVPLATLLRLADWPGEAGGFGPVDADLARAMAASAAIDPATTWCLTITDPGGHPTAHGCARPAKPRGKASPDRRPTGPAPGPAPGPTSQRTGPARKPGTKPPGAGSTATPGRSGNSPGGRLGHFDATPPGEYGTWRLRPVPGGPDLTVNLDPIAVTDCDHRHHTAAHDPGDRLRHLVEVRDGECTYPPCRRSARRCDFEHAIPWEQGGRTCACNAGARCRHHHHAKQAQGWRLDQNLPGYHTWTTPSGRRYTTGPATYPI
jgi:hypothetical protein